MESTYEGRVVAYERRGPMAMWATVRVGLRLPQPPALLHACCGAPLAWRADSGEGEEGGGGHGMGGEGPLT